MRSLGWNRKWAAWTCVCLLLGGGTLMAQAPEQHWAPTPNYPSNNPPNYQPPNGQPSNGQNGAPSAGNPAAGPPPAGQYQNPPQPDQPVGPPQTPVIERRGPVQAGPSAYWPQQPPDNRVAYPPQDPRAQGLPGQGPPAYGPPVAGPPIQGPPLRNAPPRARFVLSPEAAVALENLLTDWEKRNKEIHTMESTFFRWKYDAVFGNGAPPPPEKGVLKFAAPDKGLMKIEAKDPAQSEQWLCDGKSIFQFDYAKRVVTEYVMSPEFQGKGIGDGPLPFVFGVEAKKLKDRYFMRIITPSDVKEQVWLEAYPRYQQQAAEFSCVQVILQIGPSKALLPYAIQIFSPNGKDHIVYQLQDPKINPTIFIWDNWWVVSIPFGWTKKVDLPPPPVQAGLSPSISPQRR